MKKDTYQSAQMVVERLIEDYGQDVLKIAYLYVKDQQLAEDIFQEVFYRHRHRAEGLFQRSESGRQVLRRRQRSRGRGYHEA